jgi:5-formyltetrahydrofolate cyclo-ligase
MVDMTERKRQIRRQAIANRQLQANRESLSRVISATVEALPAYRAAQTVMYYVAMPVEVQTRDALTAALHAGKRVVVPYCAGGELELFRLADMDELEPGTLGILEPSRDLRSIREKQAHAGELDVIIVPGVAFDRRGGRLGHGKGYYDRLLARTEPRTRRIAVAYESQMFPEIPMSDHDVFMDMVVTETTVYRGPDRSAPGD